MLARGVDELLALGARVCLGLWHALSLTDLPALGHRVVRHG
jgi:hypothetical protein